MCGSSWWHLQMDPTRRRKRMWRRSMIARRQPMPRLERNLTGKKSELLLKKMAASNIRIISAIHNGGSGIGILIIGL
ncbi:unnamed protein product [Cyprideis torosa]|uniref:Uncharacterized protein n=1 Tax=Cyprideis torosa TaxID=163714 RepID=A0A7R8ZWU4_9CRUS|nr:unnamed protein product [Cyprideis torosa]CAG0909469.1 unnamed protein product [Cyprideis torosa]